MWSVVQQPADWVQLVMMITCILFGLSHILRPLMWADYFAALHAQGQTAVVTKTFALELWPALIIVTLHPVFDGAAAVVTIYGWTQAAKVVVAMFFPAVAMRSVGLARRGPRAFVGGGFLLIGIGVAAGLALFGIA